MMNLVVLGSDLTEAVKSVAPLARVLPGADCGADIIPLFSPALAGERPQICSQNCHTTTQGTPPYACGVHVRVCQVQVPSSQHEHLLHTFLILGTMMIFSTIL